MILRSRNGSQLRCSVQHNLISTVLKPPWLVAQVLLLKYLHFVRTESFCIQYHACNKQEFGRARLA